MRRGRSTRAAVDQERFGLPPGIESLHPDRARVEGVQARAAIGHHRDRLHELAELHAEAAQLAHRRKVGVEFLDPVIAPVGHEEMSERIERYRGGPLEFPRLVAAAADLPRLRRRCLLLCGGVLGNGGPCDSGQHEQGRTEAGRADSETRGESF